MADVERNTKGETGDAQRTEKKERKDNKNKRNINLVVVGHVDSGKSTTCGQLIFKCGGIDERTLARLEKEATELGKSSFKFAFLLDKMKAERERGITIDVSVNKFATNSTNYTIIDAPGHRDFIKNMITGTSHADAMLLVVPAEQGGFETAFSKDGQLREHALLGYTLGIRQIVVAVNKMDKCNYEKARYDEIQSEVQGFLVKLGFKKNSIRYVPISGFVGDNIVDSSPKMPWYSGNNLVQWLDTLEEPDRYENHPLRMPIQGSFKVGGVGTVATGRVETGSLKPGTNITIAPQGLTCDIKTIEKHHTPIDIAVTGDNIGFNLKGVAVKQLRRGAVVGVTNNNPPKGCRVFTVQVVIMRHPGKLRVKYSPVFDCHTDHQVCEFVALNKKIDKRTGKVTEENPEYLISGECGEVEVKPKAPMCVETIKTFPPLGRCALRDNRITIGVAVITGVEFEEASASSKKKK